MRRLLLLASIALSGCGDEPKTTAVTAEPSGRPAQPPTTRPEWQDEFDAEAAKIVLPVDAKHRRLSLTRDWLAGYWVNGKAACYGTDFGVRFNPDGTFSDYWDSGTYALDGATVTRVTTALTDSAEPDMKVGDVATFTVTIVGPNEIIMNFGKQRERYWRCPEGGMPQ